MIHEVDFAKNVSLKMPLGHRNCKKVSMKRSDFIKSGAGLIVGAAGLSSFATNQGVVEKRSKLIAKCMVPGDLVALTAPAGSIWNKSHIEKVEKILNDKGFKTVRGETLYMQEGYLAGSDEVRAKEFMDFIANKSVKAIVTMRGGWGCGRILDLLDYDVIRANPKIIMGFSDITSLINAIYTRTGLVTFHGPCGYSSWGDFTVDYVTYALVGGQSFRMKNPTDFVADLKTWVAGKATGELIGGNLTVITSIIGSRYEPKWDDKILFLEEIGEEPYRVDRMLWQLKQNNVFDKIKGLVIGSFKDCDPEEPEKSFSLAEVFEQHFTRLKIPVYQGAAIGHISPKFTVPIGVLAEMDATAFTITTLERCVEI